MLAGLGVLAGLTAAVIGAMSLADALTATGLPNPGPITTYGLPAVRAAGEIAAAVAVGAFLVAAFLTPPQSSGVLDVGGYRAVRLGAAASAVWSVSAAMLVALSASDVSGLPLHRFSVSDIWAVANLVEITNSWRWTAGLAAVVSVSAIAVLRWASTPFLLLASLSTLVPLGLSGHSSSGGAHDMATASLLIHLIAAALWVGGLLALLTHAWCGGGHLGVAAQRYSAVALWCFIAVALSGIVNATLRISPGGLASDYGSLLVGKAMALVALGLLGWRQRRSVIAGLRRTPSARTPLIRLGLVEAVVFAVTVGIAVGLSRTPPPQKRSETSAAEMAIGFVPAGPPTWARIAFDWRFDLILGSLAIVLAALYVAGLRRLRHRNMVWPRMRTSCWIAGCVVLLLATSSGLATYMPAMFSMHVLFQALLSFVVPILLVSGAPMLLVSRGLPAAPKATQPGPREWLRALLHSGVGRTLTHPVVVSVAYSAGIFGFYTTPIFEFTVANHSAHLLSSIYFLATGCLFFGVLTDSTRTARHHCVMMISALGTYFAIGVLLRLRTDVLGEYFYRSLGLEWHPDLLADQRLGSAVVISGAACATVLVVCSAAWHRLRRTSQFVDTARERPAR